MTQQGDASSGGAALVYTRVSGHGQEKDGVSLEVQEDACRALAARLGYTVASVVREVYPGWELFDRPQLTQVRADLRARRYAALLVYTTSRLARDPVHQAIIIEEAMRGGARVEFVNEPLDTSPEGMLIAYVRGYAAQIDLARIRAQLMGGRRKRAESGKLGNAGIDLYGYRRDRETGTRTIVEAEAVVVVRIYTLCAVEHLGIKRIARLLDREGIPTPGTGKQTRPAEANGAPARWSGTQIRNILRNPAYRGETLVWRYRSELVGTGDAAAARRASDRQTRPIHRYQRQHSSPRRSLYQVRPRPRDEALRLPDGVTPPIVDAALWDAAQEALERRFSQPTGQHTNVPYLLRGLIRCGVCGRGMEAHTDHVWGQRDAYTRTYRCASHQSLDRSCGGPRIRADAIEAWVWAEVRALLCDPEALAREAQASQQTRLTAAGRQHTPEAFAAERERISTALARVERLQARTLARYNTVDDEAVLPWSLVQAELARLDTERLRHTQRLSELEAAQTALTRTARRQASMRVVVEQLALGIDQRTHAERRVLLDHLQVRLTGNGQEWRLLLFLLHGDETTEVLRTHTATDMLQ